jgi:hypothetical protein
MTDEDTFEERTRALDAEQPVVAEEIFWKTRPSLEYLRDFARARRVSPWAMLGVTLARVVCATKPFVQLPAIIGSWASLNMLIGLVGPSGGGKDTATKAARDALDVGHAFLTAPLGSGEGLSHMFMKETKSGPEQYNDAALVTVGEIDTMTALKNRQASTVMAQIRQAAMGEQLGFFYVDTAKRMMVPEHSYRLCLIAGIQPLRAASLLDDADGGTPQRFVWLPVTDPDAPDIAPPLPTPMVWESPPWNQIMGESSGGRDRVVLDVCNTARDTIIAAHLARTRGQDGEALNGHALLTRLKVSASLALLQGRAVVTDEDWDLAGTVMTVSDRTRGGVVDVLRGEAGKNNKAQAEAEASRTIVVQERLHEAAVARVARSVKRVLARAGSSAIARAKVRQGISNRDRQHFDSALAALVLAGDVVEEEFEYQGQTGVHYRLRDDR